MEILFGWRTRLHEAEQRRSEATKKRDHATGEYERSALQLLLAARALKESHATMLSLSLITPDQNSRNESALNRQLGEGE